MRTTQTVSSAKTLGWASLAIGLTELLAPRRLEKVMGLHNGQNTGIFRVLGVREILHGFDILFHRDPAPGVWSRVAGDLLDSTLLGVAATRTRKPAAFAAIAAMVLGIGAADMICATKLST